MAIHSIIHKIAKKIIMLKHKDKIDEAKKMIEILKNNKLNILKILFSELKREAHQLFKESAILLHIDTSKIALIVDKIISVDNIG